MIITVFHLTITFCNQHTLFLTFSTCGMLPFFEHLFQKVTFLIYQLLSLLSYVNFLRYNLAANSHPLFSFFLLPYYTPHDDSEDLTAVLNLNERDCQCVDQEVYFPIA